MDLDEKKIATIFKAFCDENRIRILELLLSGEKCACILLEKLNITQPTLSHHMRILCDSGIIASRKDGKWIHYSISLEGVQVAKKYFDLLTKTNNKENTKSCCYDD